MMSKKEEIEIQMLFKAENNKSAIDIIKTKLSRALLLKDHYASDTKEYYYMYGQCLAMQEVLREIEERNNNGELLL